MRFIISTILLVCVILLMKQVPEVLFATLGLVLTLVVFALCSVFFKDLLKHDPNKKNPFACFVEVPLHHAVVIQKGGKPTHVLRGGRVPKKDAHLESKTDDDEENDGYNRKDPTQNGNGRPVSSSAFFGLWMLYKSYVMSITGLHVYFPFFYGPSTYALPRYKVKEENGKKIFTVKEDRSNHIRNELFTWYFEYTGAEIEKVPFTIKGSAQVRIERFSEHAALFKTDSWNVLLDQALNSVVRGTIRKELTLRDVIGGVDDDLWDKEKVDREDTYEVVATSILVKLLNFSIGAQDRDGDGEIDDDSKKVKLMDLGINIERIDIIDFEDELSEEERKLLRTAIYDKEAAKGEALRSLGKATSTERVGAAEAKIITKKGTATAAAQRKLAEVHAANPELGAALANADALRAFANGGSIVDALVATFVSKGNKK